VPSKSKMCSDMRAGASGGHFVSDQGEAGFALKRKDNNTNRGAAHGPRAVHPDSRTMRDCAEGSTARWMTREPMRRCVMTARFNCWSHGEEAG